MGFSEKEFLKKEGRPAPLFGRQYRIDDKKWTNARLPESKTMVVIFYYFLVKKNRKAS